MSLEHSGQTCLAHKQTGTAHYAQQSTLADLLHPACSTKQRKNNKGRLADGIRQRTRKDNLDMKKLDYTSRFVRVISTLHITQQVTVVGKIRLSQHQHLNR